MTILRLTPSAYSVAIGILALVGWISVPAHAGDSEDYDDARIAAVKERFEERKTDALRRENWQALRDVSLEQARAHANMRQPLAQADALEMAVFGASQLNRADEAESLTRQAIALVDAANPRDAADRELKDYNAIHLRLGLANRLLSAKQRRKDALALVDSVRSLCANARGRFSQRECDPNVKSDSLYGIVLARLEGVETQADRWAKAGKAEHARLQPYAQRFAESRGKADHAAVLSSGAELQAQLKARPHVGGGFLGPLVEFDRAEAFRFLGDSTSAAATLNEARNQLTTGLYRLEKGSLDSEAYTAGEIGLAAYAKQLREEGSILARIDSFKGLDKREASFDEQPSKLLEARAQLVLTADLLQSRGASLSAEFARQRIREVSAAYQKRVAEVAAERAASARVRAEDEARDRAGWDLLRGALAYAAGVQGNLNQLRASQRQSDTSATQATSGGAGAAGLNAVRPPTPTSTNLPVAQPESIRSSAGQMHSGSARDMTSGSAAGTAGRSSPGTGAGTQGSSGQSTGAVKYQSQDAKTCVEIVLRGARCGSAAGGGKFMTNTCPTTISVWWRVGTDSWNLQEGLKPGQCYPTSYYKDDRQVQYQACSWDQNAKYGPHRDPCRY